MEEQLGKIFITFSFFLNSFVVYSDCLPFYKKRVEWLEGKASKDTKLSEAAKQAKLTEEQLEMILTERNDEKMKEMILQTCLDTLLEIDPVLFDEKEKYCPSDKILQKHKWFLNHVIKENSNEKFCQYKKSTPWLSKRIGKKKKNFDKYRDYNFNLHKEFMYYFKYIYKGT